MDDATKAKLAQKAKEALAGEKWIPTVGPQTEAYLSKAHMVLYGGEAGGGKSGLLIGLALTQHKRSLLMRRQYTELNALIEDCLEKHGSRKGYSGAPPPKLRTDDDRLIEFGAAKQLGDEQHWRGQPHDFLGIDEASQFEESQVRFLMGWVRTEEGSNQRCRILLATNPPEDPGIGQWLARDDWFGAWLNPFHPNRAKPGELRWFVSDEEGQFKQVDGPEPVGIGGTTVTPQSRTFISALVDDNPFMGKEYKHQLDALPEPLRSAVRDGNWMIAHKDDEAQVIPTNWIIAAQERWTPEPPEHAPMSAMGVDIARGGDNETVIACRNDGWFGPLVVMKGSETPFGTDVAAAVIKHRRNQAAIILDMGGGWGGAPYEHLRANLEAWSDARTEEVVFGFNGSMTSTARTRDRLLAFFNKRAEAWWRFREALDPDQEGGSTIALPYDQGLVADLVAPRWVQTSRGIKIEDKAHIVKRLGRSPDRGDAVVMAWSQGPKVATHGQVWQKAIRMTKTPQVVRSYPQRRRRVN